MCVGVCERSTHNSNSQLINTYLYLPARIWFSTDSFYLNALSKAFLSKGAYWRGRSGPGDNSVLLLAQADGLADAIRLVEGVGILVVLLAERVGDPIAFCADTTEGGIL